METIIGYIIGIAFLLFALLSFLGICSIYFEKEKPLPPGTQIIITIEREYEKDQASRKSVKPRRRRPDDGQPPQIS